MLLKKKNIIIRISIIILLSLVLLANLYVIISRVAFNNSLPKIFGYGHVVVISGSMQPTLEIGDILIIREINSYEVNDIVTYKGDNSLITHRIVEIYDNEYVTKGDFNNTNDEAIPLTDIEGKVVTRIHGVGNIIFFLRTPFGILSAIIGVLVLVELPKVFKWLNSLRK